ncbi:MAG: carbamoyltransferase HypF [Chloroflexi bacterium]|nr:carbamoyltransferase HypF [Chloroflexota bacterium]
MSTPRCARQVRVRGVVQGVGFRPFVYRLALQHALAGWVRNTSWGVEIEVEGDAGALAEFERALAREAPPLARIASVEAETTPANGHTAFHILESAAQADSFQLVSPDIATCPDCLREILDPLDRRYRYPFTNCTNCGPRFTIIDDLPYDRPRTTMRAFGMCADCQREYDDPLNRRFHAQPNACPVCGPRLTLCHSDGRPLPMADPLARAAELLRAGAIVALRGLGGYQLACDATDPAAVDRLRTRKRRPHKPFALMVADLGAAEALVSLTETERALLSSPSAPIVLAPRRASAAIAPGIAPRNRYLGVMLPYTPLHHLLLRDVARPLVMTSGNLSEEPIARDNDEALARLGGIADYVLMHDREIYARYDDSVCLVADAQTQPVRRARGVAPSPIELPWATRPILACGPELKNTFCLTRERYAFVSQHIGDMQNLETLAHYEQTLALYQRLYHIAPEIIAVDCHPDYAATRYGLSVPGEHVRVQHHHAHLAACLADAGHDGPAIGVILDGTGFGLDGHIWGGEFLVGDARGLQRAARLQYLPLPGGEAAIRHPARLALGYLWSLLGDAPLPAGLAMVSQVERDAVRALLPGAPQTSSAGRLFDAVAATLGVCAEVSYEAQAAIELEMAAGWDTAQPLPEPEVADVFPYALSSEPTVLSWGETRASVAETLVVQLAPLFAGLLDAQARGEPTARSAWRFHVTLAALVTKVCGRLAAQTGLRDVALSGGCFQNRLLLALLVRRLRAAGLRVHTHRQVPTNDGGIALGQAMVAHYASARQHATEAHALAATHPPTNERS